MVKPSLNIVQVHVNLLNPAVYNPRKWNEKQIENLKASILRYGFVEPIIVNSAPNRKSIIIGGHFRQEIAKRLGYKTVPVIYVNIPDVNKEKELNLRLNQNTGEWDYDLLKEFESFKYLSIS